MKLSRKGWFAVGLTALFASGAFAAGIYSTYPIVGQNSFCVSTVSGAGGFNAAGNAGGAGQTGQGQANSGSLCAQTVPAGPPALTDEELIAADTGITNPATVTIPSGMLGSLNLKVNRLVGGDFTTNLWQRGTTPVSNATPTVATMAADRWWVISPSGTVDVLKNTPATTDADYLGSIGFYSGMKVRRHTGSTGALTCVGQTLDKAAAAPLLGNNAVLSFWAYAPATYSATNSAITVSVAYFTAADAAATQAAIGDAGGNSSTFALSAAAQASGITGYQAAVAGTSPGTTGVLASGVETINLTTTPTRYSVYAPIPVLNSAGTNVTAVGISICGTFAGTSAVTTDWFELFGAQLQAMPSAATASLPNGLIAPTSFERKNAVVEALNEYYYSYVIVESTTQKLVRGTCAASTTSISNCLIQYPTPMRIAPVAQYTAGFQTCTTVACSAAVTCSANATGSTIAWVISNAMNIVTCTSSAGGPAAGGAGFLWDLGTGSSTGVMSFSAEP